ncbi:MAG: hypothetical protein V8S93_07720 [Lachnospiraceae bacterium]
MSTGIIDKNGKVYIPSDSDAKKATGVKYKLKDAKLEEQRMAEVLLHSPRRMLILSLISSMNDGEMLSQFIEVAANPG